MRKLVIFSMLLLSTLSFSQGVSTVIPPIGSSCPTGGGSIIIYPWQSCPNLLTAPFDLTNAAWANSNITVTLNAGTAPDGTNTANKITVTTSTTALIAQPVTGSGYAGGMTYTVYAKVGTGDGVGNSFIMRDDTTATNVVNATITYSTGAIVNGGVAGTTASTTNIGSGWWLIKLNAPTGTGISNGDTIRCYVGFTGSPQTAGQFIFAWGARLSVGI